MKTKVAVGILALMAGFALFDKDKLPEKELIQRAFKPVEVALAKTLKDPESLRTHDEKFRYKTYKDGWLVGAVCGRMNAKNSYGGYGSEQGYIGQVLIDPTNGKVQVGNVLLVSTFDLNMYCSSEEYAYYNAYVKEHGASQKKS